MGLSKDSPVFLEDEMKNLSEFCTCHDTKCPLNPVNHDKGCSLCVAKCLKNGEIPNCFFKAVNSAEKPDNYTYRDFADFVLQNEK